MGMGKQSSHAIVDTLDALSQTTHSERDDVFSWLFILLLLCVIIIDLSSDISRMLSRFPQILSNFS